MPARALPATAPTVGYEPYKVSPRYDNPGDPATARLPIDPTQRRGKTCWKKGTGYRDAVAVMHAARTAAARAKRSWTGRRPDSFRQAWVLRGRSWRRARSRARKPPLAPRRYDDHGPEDIPRKPLGRTAARIRTGPAGVSPGTAGAATSQPLLTKRWTRGCFLENGLEYSAAAARRNGAGAEGRRHRSFLMTKVCHGRGPPEDRNAAAEDRSGGCDGPPRPLADPRGHLRERPGPPLRQGRRHRALGSGEEGGERSARRIHRTQEPAIHLRMLAHDYPFDTYRCRSTASDASIAASSSWCSRSSRGAAIAALGMKSSAVTVSRSFNGAVTPQEGCGTP